MLNESLSDKLTKFQFEEIFFKDNLSISDIQLLMQSKYIFTWNNEKSSYYWDILVEKDINLKNFENENWNLITDIREVLEANEKCMKDSLSSYLLPLVLEKNISNLGILFDMYIKKNKIIENISTLSSMRKIKL